MLQTKLCPTNESADLILATMLWEKGKEKGEKELQSNTRAKPLTVDALGTRIAWSQEGDTFIIN